MVTMEFLEKMGNFFESKLQQNNENLESMLQQNNENLESKWESKLQLMYGALMQATKGTCLSQTPAELGLLVKESAEVRLDCVPVPVDERLANRIWGSRDECDSLNNSKLRILKENINRMLLKVKWDQCKQEMVFTGHEREELPDQKQIDYTIYVKGNVMWLPM
ncbi:hypothetical protein GOP47_0013095 [Adiantum capillus-veneris]|uniref:Uncharacterized protein n=1 Tax=Adiantum capillus-veneris TaxID=13818 RepID=A0A9D4USD1_ADICA|nr:hypothetical protein GOP47_0013095 [Adiantum capillus-veneris]